MAQVGTPASRTVMPEAPSAFARMLLCRQRTNRLAFPIGHVIETMRPMAIEPVPHAPAFVQGVAVVRGAPVPVVDAGRLLGLPGVEPGRWVALRVGERSIVLAVEAVEGVRDFPVAGALPPLLFGRGADFVAAIGTIDAALLWVLEAIRIVPESVWQAITPQAMAR
jgi:purine-binding chemotaxis protein CheW